MIGKTLSHYKIIEQIGAGGMGEVYLADDLKLERKVAIKFLPQQLTKDRDNVERFQREAKAAASLNHPNIVTIYEIAEDGDQIFIVMEYVEGKTLREVLNTPLTPPFIGGRTDPSPIPNVQLPVPDVLKIINQIAEGLAQAHKAGIVHRDIKPENILIDNDGWVKILDFGLAKLKGVSTLTKESSTLGTIYYMSPEQVSGKEVDQRTDIWSLGVVLCEMLTGERPFKGDYEQSIVYAILNEEPQPLENIPSELLNIVKKSLNKNPQERYVSTAELLQDLHNLRENLEINKSILKPSNTKSTKSRTIIISLVIIFILIALITRFLFFPTSEPEESIKSLAVLPFTNLKSDPETNHLGGALAAGIIKELAYLHNLNVLPFSAVRYLDDWTDLNVEYILTGNYLKEKNTIRLNLELFRATNQKLIWNDELEESFKNTFKLQDLVSIKIIEGLRINFAPTEQNRMFKDIPKDPLAFDYYLRSFSYPLTNEGSTLAIKMLKNSIQLDTTYAPAFVELGFHSTRLAQHSYNKSSYHEMAKKYYLDALRLNNDLIDALVQLAGLYTDIGNTYDAYDLAIRALKINPNNAWVHYRLSYIYRYTGMLEESTKEVERTISIDSKNLRLGAMQLTYLFRGKYQKALELSRYYENNLFTKQRRGEIYYILGKLDSSLAYCNQVLDEDPNAIWGTLAWSLKAFIEKNTEEGLHVLDRWEQTNPYDSEIIFFISRLYCLHSNKEKGLRLLRKAVESGFYCYPFFLIDPFLDSVRDDPEFQEVLTLAKKKHEAFKQKYFAERE